MSNRKYKHDWYIKNRERVLEKRKKYRLENPDKIKNLNKKSYLKNKFKYHKLSKEWSKKNKDKIYLIQGRAENKRRKEQPWIFHWYKLRGRCNNPNTNCYKRYGGRGIKAIITKEEIKILWFRYKAYLMEHPTIDRIDNDGNYTLDNCQFLENIENAKKQYKNNKKKFIK